VNPGFDDRVAEHLAAHPGLSSYELARALGPVYPGGYVNKSAVEWSLQRLTLAGRVTFEYEPFACPGGRRRIWRATTEAKETAA
jgi:hypothetical protein